MRRLKLIVLMVVVAALFCEMPSLLVPYPILAAAKDWTIISLTCSTVASPLGVIQIQKFQSTDPTLGNLAVKIAPAGGGAPQVISVSAQPPLSPATPVTPDPGAQVSLQLGPTAATRLNSPPALTTGDTVALSAQSLLQPGTTVTLLDQTTSPATPLPGSQTCPALGLSRQLFVSTAGFDLLGVGVPNSTCGPDLLPPETPNPATPGPCLTIQNALTYARDGDEIIVEAGSYEVCSPIQVSKLVKISANGSKVILHSFNGDSIFDVTAIGAGGGQSGTAPSTGPASGIGPASASQFAQIDGFDMGGATNPGAAAVVLDDDAYTEVTNNVIGGDPLVNPTYTGVPCTASGQPLPPGTAGAQPAPVPVQKTEPFGNAESILLNSSDHPFIANNDILGAAIFQFSPVLATGQVLTGFGIVTTECLGMGADVSDSVTIINNLLARNVNAGIWLCSDGGGLHQIKSNVVRNNGRGIVLRAIDDTTIDSNQITDDYQDGVIVYDASNNNTITNNTIESNETPGAAGIRLGGFGAGLFPLATTLGSNTLLRNWVDLVITGARNTQLYGNTITADRDRTGILIQVGSQGAQSYTQPDGTFIGVAGQPPNKIISNGQCGAASGCAIRLDQGVTSNVDATGTFSSTAAPPGPTPPPVAATVSFNNFGLPPGADINTVLWHRPNDPTLGFINTGTNVIPAPSVTPTAIPTIAPATASPTPGM